MEIKRVALIGLGAIGSYLAPRIEQAVGRDNFCVVAGGARRERLLSQGTDINGVNHRFRVVSPGEKTEPASLVMVVVKHNQLPQAVEDIACLVGPDTVLVSFMNGITSEQTLAEAYGWDRVVYGLTRVSIVMQNYAVSYDPSVGMFLFGEAKNDPDHPTERIAALAALFEKAGIRYRISRDMVQSIWLKFMANVSENQSSAILGIPFGAWQVSDEANILREAAMREVIAIGNKLGIDMGEKHMLRQREQLMTIPYNNKTSMLQDLENGRKTEVEMFAGTVIRLGRELGIPTPINEVFYHCIRVLEEKNEGRI
jgi:2-dehydropantoate 2-reductase